MRVIAIVAICVTAAIVAVGDNHHGNDGIVQKALSLRRLQFGPKGAKDCSAIRGTPNSDCLEESESGSSSDGGPELVAGRDPTGGGTDSPSDEDDCNKKRVPGMPVSLRCQGAFNHASDSEETADTNGSGPELVGGNPNSSGTPQQGDDGCSTTMWSWGTPQGPGCSQSGAEDSNEGPSLVGVNPDDARAPSLLRLNVYRENFKLRRNKKKLERFTKNRGYSFEYFLEEYRIQRRGLRGSQRTLEDGANFQDITYTRVRVSDVGVTRPAGHESASNLINRIQDILQDARGDPSKLGHYRLVYSRRFGLPRFCYIEYDGHVTKIAARRLRFTDAAASPTN